MRSYRFVFLSVLFILFSISFACADGKRKNDGWLGKSQKEYLEYKYRQDHNGQQPSGRAEIRAHEMYPHVHYPEGYVGVIIQFSAPPPQYSGGQYWNGQQWVNR